MSKNWKITIGVIIAVIVLVGLGMLRWGSRVYWTSGGERGWSLGASIYQMLGWGTEAYRADFGWDDYEDCESDCDAVENSWDHHRRFGPGFVRHRDRGGHVFFAGGMGCLSFFVLLSLVGLGVVGFRRWRETHPSTPVTGE